MSDLINYMCSTVSSVGCDMRRMFLIRNGRVPFPCRCVRDAACAASQLAGGSLHGLRMPALRALWAKQLHSPPPSWSATNASCVLKEAVTYCYRFVLLIVP
jgi:hypothetical protein